MDLFYITDLVLEKGRYRCRYARRPAGGDDEPPPRDLRVFLVKFEKVDLDSASW